jgi:hypothetical protein
VRIVTADLRCTDGTAALAERTASETQRLPHACATAETSPEQLDGWPPQLASALVDSRTTRPVISSVTVGYTAAVDSGDLRNLEAPMRALIELRSCVRTRH